MPLKILVTGASGYVGSHVVKALKARGVEVVALCRDEDGRAAAIADGMQARIAALGDPAALTAIAAEVDGAAHLAASEAPAFLDISRIAAMALIDGLPSGAGFIMQGGSMVFGPTGSGIHPGLPPFAAPPPLAARAALDELVLARTATGVRTHVVYGAMVMGGSGAMIPNLLVNAARKAGFSGYAGDGIAVWSVVHVEDWADLMVRVLLDGKTAGQAVVAAAQSITLRQLAQSVARAVSPALAVRSVDAATAQELWGFFAPGLSVSQHFDGDRPRHDYGWNPPLRDVAAEMANAAARMGA
jgi:nucleoside-diphosphate-sugar epimerase